MCTCLPGSCRIPASKHKARQSRNQRELTAEDLALLTKISNEGKPDVFISYAKADNAIAENVEAFLNSAGIRVFRDTHIPAGGNWDAAIEEALQECQRMVLLLSSSSMPLRKEVHREWFYFDQKAKPIHPLYIQDCELHSRMRAYNYIDARRDLKGALDRLLKDLRSGIVPPRPITGAETTSIVENAEAGPRTLPEALEALLDAVRSPEGSVVLSAAQANAIKDHKPASVTEYRLGRIAEWALPRHYLDKRFVNLTLVLDKGENEPERWVKSPNAEDFRFDDLRAVLQKTGDDPALVLLGAPGSGKSTLLRRLQLDHSIDRLRDNTEQISFFIQLNGYNLLGSSEPPQPREWLEARWAALYPGLPPLETYLREGRALLLLDALNEMPHKNASDYYALAGLWRAFAQDAARAGNRIVFSCRSLDYSASLSSPELRVPQVEVQPMNAGQVRRFLRAYTPAHEERVWRELDGSPQFGLFQTPYFLKLLCDQVEKTSGVPKGRAALFTGFVRQALGREIHRDLFQKESLLGKLDRQKLSRGEWANAFDLPERGALIPKLSDLAFSMQERRLETEASQVRLGYDDACALLGDESILEAGEALNVLDRDVAQGEILFFHQLLQEYFAARRLAKKPDPQLLHVEWAADGVRPALKDTLAGLASGDPLPPLPQTGWEETTMTAAPIAKDPQAFIRALIPHNLPLAARCAASPEVRITAEFKREIQDALIGRTQDARADLRARIAAGEALGEIGDPRFERRTGLHGDYLLPPLVDIPGGTYPMGDDGGNSADEKPAHTVELAPFQIGQFPVTNAEYALFSAAGGYEDKHWWDTPEALAWLSGEASTEGRKQQWRDDRKTFQGWPEYRIPGLVRQNRITPEQAEDWTTIRNWSSERFEKWLDENFPSGKLYRQPEYWDDTRFQNKSQPVVGVTWFEARAYCNWLTANALANDKIFRLPSEAEFEAAARGKMGRPFAYGKNFDVSRCNTFESHIRRTTPVGIFDNATPEGTFDMSGNAYTWTLSIYDQEQFPYPYKRDDGREDIHKTGVRRVLRGGSWLNSHVSARAVYRSLNLQSYRNYNVGFRVVCVVRPPSL